MGIPAEQMILGIDAGTSMVKVALFDARGHEQSVVRRRTELVSPHPLWSETDMDALWLAVASSVRQLLAESGVQASQVAAVGLTGTMVGAWLIDADGRPVRNGILWNDGRTQPLIERLSAEIPGFMRAIFLESGSVMQQGCTLPLLRWLAENEPETLERAAAVLSCKDWIGYRLTGALSLDPSLATVHPGSAKGRGSSEAMTRLLGVERLQRLFPSVRASESIAGEVTAEAAMETGLRTGTPVGVGAGDVIASAIGLGAVEPETACTLLGTNILNGLVVDTPLLEPEEVGLLFTLPEERWLRAMHNISGTTSLDWFIAQFCPAERAAVHSQAQLFAQLEMLVESSPPGAAGVLYLSYLSDLGITTPFYEPAARAQFFGLSERHTRADMLRAVYEGIALSIRNGYAMMPAPVRAIYLSGGGARSRFWSQLIADVCGVSINVPQGVTEYGAKGAALLAAVGIGWYASVTDAAHATIGGAVLFEPQERLLDLYTRRYEVYARLQNDLRPAWRMAASA